MKRADEFFQKGNRIMAVKKPSPLIEQPIAKTCPVCGKSSYSLGGIHPQCAAKLADAPRRKRLAVEKKAKTIKSSLRTWEKTCPKCQTRLPARRGFCECGHDFARKY